MDLSIRSQDLQRKTSSSSHLGFLQRRLTQLSNGRRVGESPEQIWGSLGLNLLHQPAEPSIDLIFVHGLRGGSRKTWSYSDNPLDFWPKEWLPRDPDFKHARIHSFGYNADWGERKESALNIHDFGKELLGDIENSPEIRGDGDSDLPVVLVGHSMGGLVIKKAYLLAKLDNQYQAIAARFHSIFFLGTPHRGAESAQMLNNILRASIIHSTRSYVSDLEPRSAMLQIINDEFRLMYGKINLWSFYETVKTKIGGNTALIVEKDSAVIGLPEEKTRPINADHRHVCKFETPTDNNYVTLRNALASCISTIVKERKTMRKDKLRTDMRLLENILGVTSRPEEDVLELENDRVQGSCEWLVNKPSFIDWMEEIHQRPKFFHLSGNPATGKSVLTSYVVSHLEGSNKDCSSFFFRHNDKSRSSISSLLRSLAYQMALANADIRLTLLALRDEDDTKLDQVDDRTIWRQVFTTRIFRTKFRQPQFWVIDALDECNNYATFVPMLAKIDEKIPLRVFVSSRASPELDRMFSPIAPSTVVEHMSLDQTQVDIRLFIEANIHNLPVDGEAACHQLITKILEKSNDCFLWAYLVLKELEQTYSEEQIMEVLDEVPKEMNPLYTRILEGMAKNRRNVDLIKALLTWTVCATRPLEVEELKEAIKLDIGVNVPRLDMMIKSICGHILYIDQQSRVHLIHQTAREFLLSQDTRAEFSVTRGIGHAQLAATCLRYLNGSEMSPPVLRRRSSVSPMTNRSCFADYASTAFSEHMVRSSPAIDLPLALLDAFFKTNVLSWVEHLAAGRNLFQLMHTAGNLKAYLQRRADERSPLGHEVKRVEAWATDLIRITMAFGDNLVDFPPGIHFLIPPFCPSNSMMHRKFISGPRTLEVLGLTATDWDNRLSCLTYRDEYGTTVACRDNRFAVGLSKGTIVLYGTATCREIVRMNHEERVRCLVFGNANTHLATSGRKTIRLWNSADGQQIWSTNVPDEPLALSFHNDDEIIFAATRANKIASWQVASGRSEKERPWFDEAQSPTSAGNRTKHRRTPTVCQFSEELNILAICYRSKPMVIWDLEDDSLVGTFDRRTSPEAEATGAYFIVETRVPSAAAVALAFNPDPNIRLLAIAYQDGDLAVIDPLKQHLKAPIIVADASVLAASPDGKTLATGDAAGTIKLFNFETLEPLYRLACSGYDIKALAFSSDGLRVLDVRGSQCNVWEPAVLVRKQHDDSTEDSQDGAPLGPVQTIESQDRDEQNLLTAVVIDHTGKYLFCAKEDGSVWVYNTQNGSMVEELYRHDARVAVSLLCWCAQGSLLASVDLSGRFVVRKIMPDLSGRWVVGKPVLDDRSEQSIHQIELSPVGDRLLLSTASFHSLWNMEGQEINRRKNLSEYSSRWITHPRYPGHLVQFGNHCAHIFDWNSFQQLTPIDGIMLHTTFPAETTLRSVRVTRSLSTLVLEHEILNRHSTNRFISIWDPANISLSVHETKPLAIYDRVPVEMAAVVGLSGSRIVFLDYSGWVCTLDLKDRRDNSYIRHFSFPASWQNASRNLICHVTSREDVVLVQEDDIAVVRDGLYFENEVDLDTRPVIHEPTPDDNA